MYQQRDNKFANDGCKIFCGGLNRETTKETLSEYLGQFGTISDCFIVFDKERGQSKGFGFVTFSCVQDVDNVQSSKPHTVDGKQFETKRSIPKDPNNQASSEPTQKLYVYGVKEETTEDDIRGAIDYGVVEKVDFVTKDGVRKPFCFVTFSDSDAVDRFHLQGKLQTNAGELSVKKAAEKNQGGGPGGRGGRGGRGGFQRGGRGGRGGGRGGYGGDSYGQGGYDNYGQGGGYDTGYGGGGYNQGYDYGGYGQQSYGGSGGYGNGGSYGGGRGGAGQRYQPY